MSVAHSLSVDDGGDAGKRDENCNNDCGGSNSGESPSTAAEEEGPVDNASLKILCSLSIFSFLVSIFGGHEFLCLL